MEDLSFGSCSKKLNITPTFPVQLLKCHVEITWIGVAPALWMALARSTY